MRADRWTLRRGQVSDAAELATFAARTFVEAFGAENDPEDLRAHLEASFGVAQQTEQLEDPETITVLAHAEGELRGLRAGAPQ